MARRTPSASMTAATRPHLGGQREHHMEVGHRQQLGFTRRGAGAHTDPMTRRTLPMAACDVRRRPPRQTGRPPSSPRHGGRRPRPVAAGRPSSRSSCKSIPSRARPATASGASSRSSRHRRSSTISSPPPDPRRPRVARRAAEPPLNAGPREPRRATRPAPVGRHHDLRVRTAPPTPRDQTGPFGVRGGPTAAAPQSPPASAGPGSLARTAGPPTREAHRGTPARWRSRRRPLTSARKAGDRGILPPPRLNPLSGRCIGPWCTDSRRCSSMDRSVETFPMPLLAIGTSSKS
jgi:hypothetical protein